MKVIVSEEGYLKFDNGLILESNHEQRRGKELFYCW